MEEKSESNVFEREETTIEKVKCVNESSNNLENKLAFPARVKIPQTIRKPFSALNVHEFF